MLKILGGTALTAPVTGLVRGSDGADTYSHHITHALIRKVIMSSTSQYEAVSYAV